MTKTIKEETVTFSQYKDAEKDTDVRIFVCGFVPTYNPIICTKGQPKTMNDLKDRLENLLGVHVAFSEPTP